MNIIFMGTMEFAVPILEGLIETENVLLVVTQPDRPFGRKHILKPSSVKLKALEHGITVFQPEKIKENVNPILELHPDVIIVAAYGQMIPNIILTTPPFRCINVHASLLPKYRGGAPMHKSIQNGEAYTGVTIMNMAMKMDSGDILTQRAIPILDTDDVGSMQEKLGLLGRDLLLETLPKVFSGEIVPVKQDESQITFAYNIKPSEEHINFNQTARQVFNHVRGYHPWPLTYTLIDDQMLKLYQVKISDETAVISSIPGEILEVTKNSCIVQTEKGTISLVNIQLQGKTPMDISTFLNGVGKTLLVPGKILK
ncbi:MAG: methionyl-tRNA formyltransferase [Candidatus Izemoplasmatales bacterium]|nr:methionyl-tRNA formyltransferase [Candidatus Izemoplasmatales bacterium]